MEIILVFGNATTEMNSDDSSTDQRYNNKLEDMISIHECKEGVKKATVPLFC